MVHRYIPIRAALPNHKEIVVKIDAAATVKDLKKILLEAVPALGPHTSDFRVVQRGMELNEKGTLVYYHIVDACVVSVIKKVGPSKERGEPLLPPPRDGPGSQQPQQQQQFRQYQDPMQQQQQQYADGGYQQQQGGGLHQRSSSAPTANRSRPGSSSGTRPPTRTGPPALSDAVNYNTMSGPHTTQTKTRPPPHNTTATNAATLTYPVYGVSNQQQQPQALGGTWNNSLDVSASTRYSTLPIAGGVPVDEDEALMQRLEAGVLALQRDVQQQQLNSTLYGGAGAGGSVTTTRAPLSMPIVHGATLPAGGSVTVIGGGGSLNGSTTVTLDVALLQQKLHLTENRLRVVEGEYHDAMKHIEELEATVKRYQTLLRRATSPVGSSAL